MQLNKIFNTCFQKLLQKFPTVYSYLAVNLAVLQRQNTVYSHKKYVILQHLLLMRLIVDTMVDGPKVPNVRRT